MMRLLRCLLPLVFPLFLSILPLFGLFVENHQRQELEREQEKARWQSRAANLMDEVRLLSTFEGQANQMLGEMKQRFLRITDPGFRLSGRILKAALHRAFPRSHLPADALVFGFRWKDAARLELLSDSGLTISGGRLLADFLSKCLGFERIGKSERRMLQNRCAGLFGDFIELGHFVFDRRGKTIFARYNGVPAIILWDTLETHVSNLGAFLCVIPIDVTQRLEPLSHALKKSMARYPGMLPCLLPLETRAGKGDARVPAKTRIPRSLWETIQDPGKPENRGDFSQGPRFQEVQGKWWVTEDLFSVDLPYRIVVAGSVPRPRATAAEAIMLLLGIALASLWSLVFSRVLVTGEPLRLSMRFWVLCFFTMLGGLSLSALFFFGTYSIDTALSRQMNDEMKEFREKLESVETGVSSLFQHHTRLCRQFLFDRDWFQKVLFESPARKEQIFLQTVDDLRRQSPAIFLDGMMVFGLHPPRECEVFSTPRSLFATGRLGSEIFTTFFKGTAGNWDVDPAVLSRMGNSTQNIGKRYDEIFSTFLDPNIFSIFSSMRQRADIMSNSGNQIILFYDFLAREGKLLGGILLVMNPIDAYRNYLSKTVSLLAFNSTDHQVAFGERVRGCHRPVFPALGPLWKRKSGRILRSLMDLATEMGTEQVLELPGMAIVARPCTNLKGFILGGIVSFDRFQREADQKRGYLAITIVGLLMLFILLGVATSNYLLVPLSQVKEALLRLATGDLRVRVGLSRRDELGDLTRSFDQMIQGIQERQELGLFVSKSLNTTIGDSLTAPEQRMGTILVSDLRNFTTLSETHPPEEIIAMLNHHHHAMAEVIQKCGGIVELFIGDAIVAVFYEKTEGDGARAALEAACAMTVTHLRIQTGREREGRFGYDIGIGIDRGPILAGSLGNAERSEYVVLGRPRQQAEALEAVSKKGRFTRIVVSAAVRSHFPPERFTAIEGTGGFELESLA